MVALMMDVVGGLERQKVTGMSYAETKCTLAE